MRLVPVAVVVSLIVMGSASRVDAQSVEPGRRVFASRCAACHGTEGGGGELGPSIVARIPLRTDADLEAVFAYLQSIPPITNHVPEPRPAPVAATTP